MLLQFCRNSLIRLAHIPLRSLAASKDSHHSTYAKLPQSEAPFNLLETTATAPVASGDFSMEFDPAVYTFTKKKSLMNSVSTNPVSHPYMVISSHASSLYGISHESVSLDTIIIAVSTTYFL